MFLGDDYKGRNIPEFDPVHHKVVLEASDADEDCQSQPQANSSGSEHITDSEHHMEAFSNEECSSESGGSSDLVIDNKLSGLRLLILSIFQVPYISLIFFFIERYSSTRCRGIVLNAHLTH